MLRVQLAELKDSWRAWTGVCLAFVVTNFTLILSALAMNSGLSAIRAGRIELTESAPFVFFPGFNLVLCGIVGIVVIANSTELVVTTRRTALARSALSGATPGQIVGQLVVQLAVLSVVCSVIGGVLAYLALPGTIDYLGYEREVSDVAVPVPDPDWNPLSALAAAAGAVLVAVVGGSVQALTAARISPLEALRASTGLRHETRMTILRWIASVVTVLVTVGAFALIPVLAANRTKETISNILILSLLVLLLGAALIACFAPLLVRPLTRAWTSVVPERWPAWRLARRMTIARAPQLIRCVVPMAVVIGLTFGMITQGDTLVSTLAANGYFSDLSGVGAETFLVSLGLPLLVAISGTVGALIMLAAQRDAELALLGIAGATPAQRLVIPAVESAILVVTSTVLGVGMVVLSISYLAIGIPAGGLDFALRPSWGSLLVTMLVVLAVVVVTTLVPTLRARRLPEPEVIDRLAAS